MAAGGFTAMVCVLLLHGPRQPTDVEVPLGERTARPAHLVAIPDVTPLELGQGHVATVDVDEDGGDFHGRQLTELPPSIVKKSRLSWLLAPR